MRTAVLLQLRRLPHPAQLERRPGRLRSRRRRAERATLDAGAAPGAATPAPRAQPPRPAPARALARAREAGGPIDNACYTCACGCVFAASVSTTVACPHCGAGQAW